MLKELGLSFLRHDRANLPYPAPCRRSCNRLGLAGSTTEGDDGLRGSVRFQARRRGTTSFAAQFGFKLDEGGRRDLRLRLGFAVQFDFKIGRGG